MKHPNPEKQKSQEEFLKNCPEEERELHAQIFRTGNAMYVYHMEAMKVKEKDLIFYYQEWLQGLPPNISEDMKKLGFEYCKTVLPFTRYVNERLDNGLNDWLREHLSKEDFEFLSSHDKTSKEKE